MKWGNCLLLKFSSSSVLLDNSIIGSSMTHSTKLVHPTTLPDKRLLTSHKQMNNNMQQLEKQNKKELTLSHKKHPSFYIITLFADF